MQKINLQSSRCSATWRHRESSGRADGRDIKVRSATGNHMAPIPGLYQVCRLLGLSQAEPRMFHCWVHSYLSHYTLETENQDIPYLLQTNTVVLNQSIYIAQRHNVSNALWSRVNTEQIKKLLSNVSIHQCGVSCVTVTPSLSQGLSTPVSETGYFVSETGDFVSVPGDFIARNGDFVSGNRRFCFQKQNSLFRKQVCTGDAFVKYLSYA